MNQDITQLFKVFADKNRLNIIERLLNGETCGCTLINSLDISQPTLSYHLKYMTNAELATTKREGNWIKHYIDEEKINDLINYLEKLKKIGDGNAVY